MSCQDGSLIDVNIEYTSPSGDTTDCIAQVEVLNWQEVCCTDTLYVELVSNGQCLYLADSLIYSETYFTENDSIIFQSGMEILLEPGFEVPLGKIFHALIRPCE